MTWSARKCSLTGLQWSLGLFLIYQCSVLLFAHAAAENFSKAHLPQWFRIGIAAVELLGALLFLLPPTMLVGGRILIGTFIVAAAVHLLHGQRDIFYLVIYGMAVLTVMTGHDRT
jgi:uncharacterized membrane protein YhdT